MSGYTTEIDSAIALWNAVPNVRLIFSLYNGTIPANVTIEDASSSLPSNVCGRAYSPMNGQPGSLIMINTGVISGNTFQQRKRTIAHEMGHAIGFRHTNWEGGSEPQNWTGPNGAKIAALHAMGTPTENDSQSMMNLGECGIGATNLSAYDILAYQFFYPASPIFAGTVPVFRYYGLPDHFYTTNYSELGDGSNNNYIFEGIGFWAFDYAATGTVPVYRYLHRTNNEHFYTTAYGSYGGYNYEGIGFYAYPSNLNGSIPILRYYQSSSGDHFYTKNSNEFFFSSSGYSYELIAFYGY